MKLPEGLTPQEIRILQEYRRMGRQEMTLEEILRIKHPVEAGEAPVHGLVEKGYLQGDDQGYALSEKGSDFLAQNPEPEKDRWS